MREHEARKKNKVYIEQFQNWLESAGFSQDTVRRHVDHAKEFCEYLVFKEPIQTLKGVSESEFFYYLTEHIPLKVIAGRGVLRAVPASLKVLANWMEEVGLISDSECDDIIDTLKTERADYLRYLDTGQPGENWLWKDTLPNGNWVKNAIESIN